MPHPTLGGDWVESLKLLSGQGMLWDIVVSGASLRDWEAALAALREAAKTDRDIDLAEDISEPVDVAFHRSGMDRRLVVKLGGAEAHAHFFSEDEIEFDVDPRTLTQQDGPALLSFMKLLATSTNRRCLLTPENFHHRPLLVYEPVPDTFSLHDAAHADE